MAGDERIERGMRTLLAERRRVLDAGARPLGWKLGFGSLAAFERLGTSEPLVGFLTDATLVEPGATVPLAGYANPLFEPELAGYVDENLELGAVGQAIELADVDFASGDAEAVLAGNVCHRAVVLGPERAPSVDGLRVRVLRGAEEIVAGADPQAVTGELAALVRHVRELLPRFGEELRPGDVVIGGATVPVPAPAPGDRIRYELEPLGSLELAFS